jgi:hypothetical protein
MGPHSMIVERGYKKASTLHTISKHRHQSASALLSLPDVDDILNSSSLYNIMMHENEAGVFPNVNTGKYQG